MIAHEFFELDDIIEELRMVTDTLCALEVATTESSSIIPGEAWTLPCLMLKNRIKDLTEKYNTVFMRSRSRKKVWQYERDWENEAATNAHHAERTRDLPPVDDRIN